MTHVHICDVLTVKRHGAIFCGLEESACDKSDDTDGLDDAASSIYQHNTDWETDPKRFVVSETAKKKRADSSYFSCPMYLTAIEEVDQSWSENEYECLEKFHRIRSLKYLRQAYDQLGSGSISTA